MAGPIAGNLIAVTVNGQKLRCQTAGTLTITVNTTTAAACKPDDATPPESASWVTATADSRAWNITCSMKAFLDDLQLSGHDVAALIIANTPNVEVEFGSTAGQHDFPEDIVYSGPAIVSSWSFAAPGTGEATHDMTFTGNGALAQDRVPVVT